MHPHKVAPTCDSVFNGTRCSETRRLVGDNKTWACPRNHDYKVRLFMGAMHVPHELGFYGISETRAQVHIAPFTQPDITPLHEPDITPSTEPDVTADWMMSDVKDQFSGHEEVVAIAEAEERDLGDGDCAQTLDKDTLPDIDLIMFS